MPQVSFNNIFMPRDSESEQAVVAIKRYTMEHFGVLCHVSPSSCALAQPGIPSLPLATPGKFVNKLIQLAPSPTSSSFGPAEPSLTLATLLANYLAKQFSNKSNWFAPPPTSSSLIQPSIAQPSQALAQPTPA
ncbi:hypothetical protein BY996DRAFT_6415336 [Phakopsora pachyrhizi]|nr:hypothetical protein BY996DRAFT_6415336 [Phakopsora pachyrhizi]